MPAFVSPVLDPATWTFTTTDNELIPDGLRYSGYRCRGLRAAHAPDESVRMPATGILRRATDGGGRVFVEVQVNPFPIRGVAAAVPGGLPTFYLVFADATGLGFMDGDTGLGGTALRPASAVTILVMRQDRHALDPALWAAQLLAALTAGGGDTTSWQPFADAVSAAIGTGATAPVLLYNHAGQLWGDVSVDIVLGPPGGETVHRAVMTPADGGDLQRTVARLNAANPVAMPLANLWGSGRTSFRLRPVAAAVEHIQLARLEDSLAAATEITLTPAQRNAAFTDLTGWFAAQRVQGVANVDPLERFTRGNLVTPLVNGPAFFDDLFVALRDAQRADGGFHLAGWAMFPQTRFTKRGWGDDPQARLTLAQATALLGADNIPLTLEQAASLIGAAGGRSCFLPSKHYQLDGGAVITTSEALIFYFLMTGTLILNEFGVAFARTDPVGTVLLLVAFLAATAYTAYVVDNNGDPVEPNKDAVAVLGAVTRTGSPYSPYPARVEDNVPAAPMTGVPFGTIFAVTRHFGVYHQKLAIVKAGATHIGYCGGVDCNPDRLDDANHLLAAPFHDVHVRIEGNAVRDLALTFQTRWERDGGTTPRAFDAPQPDNALAPGGDIAQIARTYFGAAPGSGRELAFAPDGDRTLADTLLAAIAGAKECIYIEDQYLTPPTAYHDALVAKVASGDLKQLVIVVPGLTDQPFGLRFRGEFIQDLVDADPGGVVRVGCPRRRFLSTDNDIRASSGRLLLGQDLAAGGGTGTIIWLGPRARIPGLPFWASVEGELLYVYDEAIGTGAPAGPLSIIPNLEPAQMRAFYAERGEHTHLLRGDLLPGAGATAREHQRGAPVTVGSLSDIYVHAKMMVVDDVFLAIGSANINNRGLFSDGEVNCFTIPDRLRASARNPALALRRELWAEMMDLPAGMIGPLLTDPLAAARLFDRSPFAGNRFVPLDARPSKLMLGYTPGDGAFMDVIIGLGFTFTALNVDPLFMNVVDPTSRTVNA